MRFKYKKNTFSRIINLLPTRTTLINKRIPEIRGGTHGKYYNSTKIMVKINREYERTLKLGRKVVI